MNVNAFYNIFQSLDSSFRHCNYCKDFSFLRP